jgi:autotransporter-associated beta strand protein
MKTTNRMTTAATFAVVTITGLALTASPARAATFFSSATAPTVDGADIANLGGQAGSDKWFFQSGNEVDPADHAKGQTFTTGPAAVLLNALTYKIAPGNMKAANTTYTIRVGMPSGTTFNQIYSETALQTVNTAAGAYMTWTFATPVLLLPDTTYAIDVAMVSAVGWQTGIPYLSYTSNTYAGGQFYNSGPAGGSGGGTTISVNANLDRVFHLDLTVAPAFAYWDLNGNGAGPGGATPAGTWNAANTNWNPAAEGTGSTVAWLPDFTAVFAAGTDATGTYTVTVDGMQDIGGLAFEEGTVTLTPGTAGGLRLVGDASMVVASGLTATVATPNSEDDSPRALTKGGDGILILSGANAYTGATTVQAGTLRLGADQVLPDASAMMLSAQAAGVIPTLDLNGYNDIIGSLALGGTTPASGAAVTTGAGTLTLGGDVTYNPYGIDLLGATVGGKLDLGETRTFTVNNSVTAANDLTVLADISGAGFGLVKEGAGTLVLAGNNLAATGGITLNAGAVRFDAPASLNGTARDVVVNAGGTVVFGPSFGAANIPAALSDRIVASSAGTLAADHQEATNFDFNTPGLTDASFGAVGSVTYTGTLTPAGTTYRLGGGGGILTMANPNAITNSGNELVVIGPGTVVLANANDYAGGTTVSGGTLQIGTGGTLGSLNPNCAIITDATLAFNRSDTVTQGADFASVISGLGGVMQAGSGTLILNGANDYTGPTTVSAGTLRLADTSTVAYSSGLFLNAGTLQLLSNDPATFDTPDIQIAPGATATIEVNNNGAGTGNTLMLSGGIVSSNSTAAIATVNLTGGNDYVLSTPRAAVNTGGGSPKMRVNPTTASIRIGTFNSACPAVQRATIYLGGTSAGNAVDTITPCTNLGTVELVKEGQSAWTVGNYCTPAQPQGTVTITDGTLTVTGTLCPQGGTLLNGGQLNYDNAGAVRGAMSINGGNLDNTSGAAIPTSTYNPAQTWSSDFTFIGSQGANSDLNLGTGAVALGATRQVTVSNPATTLTVGGVISGAGRGLTKAGPGTLSLGGANTYTGATAVNEGTLALVGGSQASEITVASGASLGFTLGSPTTSIAAVTLGGTVTITGEPPVAPTSYLLMTASSIAGTPTLSTAISGYALVTANGGTELWLKPANTFAAWLQLNPPATGFTTDTDHDGLANGVENVLGGDPNVFDAGLIRISATANSATFKHQLNPTKASDVTYNYQWSTDLVEWKAGTETNSTGTTATIEASTPDADHIVTVVMTVTNGPAARLFGRLVANQQ